MTKKTKINTDQKKKIIINRYGWIVAGLLLVFFAVIVFTVKIMYVEGDQWRELGKKETVQKNREVLATRGNIYAFDGRLLAASQPLYGIYMDFMAEGMKKDTLMKYIDQLSGELGKNFPEKSKEKYKKLLMDNWNLSRKELAMIEAARRAGSNREIKKTTRYVRIIDKEINFLELQKLRTFPFFNQRSSRSGLKTEEKTSRDKPFGRLAGRTVGTIYKDVVMGGASGIELKCDSVLRGVNGVKAKRKVQGQWIDVIQQPAIDGMDVMTTLDIGIQDIAEKALLSKLTETNAESGCAVIMEVETGEIKAIVNLDKLTGGGYAEGNPNVFSYMSEPGSTFKAMSLMVALEDGVVSPNDKFYVGKGTYDYGGRTVRDHDWRSGRDKGEMTVTEGMYNSSNVLVSKMILKGYENQKEKFVEGLYKIGLNRKIDWDVPLKGIEGTVNIRHPKDKSARYWSQTTLPWMSFGYETQVPPIYMLMFYNGIANGGKMIKPFIIKSFQNEGITVEERSTEVINPKMCSPKTLKEIQEILVGVINHGTGKPAGSKYFQVAGKTGTALIAEKGGYENYFVSFCGYFPADKPQYTCFVGLRKPQGPPSGGYMAGVVFKNIAEGIYAKDICKTPILSWANDSLPMERMPYIKFGSYQGLKTIFDRLNMKYVAQNSGSGLVALTINYGQIVIKQIPDRKGYIPNVKGMGARDALFVLESLGLKVKLQGRGKVVSQSVEPDTKAVTGSSISIILE